MENALKLVDVWDLGVVTPSQGQSSVIIVCCRNHDGRRCVGQWHDSETSGCKWMQILAGRKRDPGYRGAPRPATC